MIDFIPSSNKGIFEELVCTGQFLKDEDGNQLHVKIGKAEVPFIFIPNS